MALSGRQRVQLVLIFQQYSTPLAQVRSWRLWSFPSGYREISQAATVLISEHEVTRLVGKAFELLAEAANKDSTHSPWAEDAGAPTDQLESGRGYAFKPRPFQGSRRGRTNCGLLTGNGWWPPNPSRSIQYWTKETKRYK